MVCSIIASEVYNALEDHCSEEDAGPMPAPSPFSTHCCSSAEEDTEAGPSSPPSAAEDDAEAGPSPSSSDAEDQAEPGPSPSPPPATLKVRSSSLESLEEVMASLNRRALSTGDLENWGGSVRNARPRWQMEGSISNGLRHKPNGLWVDSRVRNGSIFPLCGSIADNISGNMGGQHISA
jgi:hypothetical protein